MFRVNHLRNDKSQAFWIFCEQHLNRGKKSFFSLSTKKMLIKNFHDEKYIYYDTYTPVSFLVKLNVICSLLGLLKIQLLPISPFAIIHLRI